MGLLILGAGGVGSAAARIAGRRPFLEHVVLADYDLGRAERPRRAPRTSSGWTGSRSWTSAEPW